MLTNMPVLATLASGALVVALAGIVRWRQELAETTLVPAWWWALFAALAWGGVEFAAAASGLQGASWQTPLRFAAVSLSLCPVIAVLGAKRPQHAAWSFVVASLWGILALPAAETFFLQRGQRLEINAFRGWFLWILILLGPINYLPTRRWPTALLLAAAQVLALAEHLPLARGTWFGGQTLAALGLAALAPWAVDLFPRSGRAPGPYGRLWLDFRDTFGLFWSLRLQERVNAVAHTNHWPLDLFWAGFRVEQTDSTQPQSESKGQSDDALAAASGFTTIDPAIEPTLRTTMKGLLRRFVSSRWIARRLDSALD